MNHVKILAMLDAFLASLGLDDRVYDRSYCSLAMKLYKAEAACRSVQSQCLIISLGDPEWVKETDEEIVESLRVKYEGRANSFRDAHTNEIKAIAEQTWTALGNRLNRSVEAGRLPAEAVAIFNGKLHFDPTSKEEGASDDPKLF